MTPRRRPLDPRQAGDTPPVHVHPILPTLVHGRAAPELADTIRLYAEVRARYAATEPADRSRPSTLLGAVTDRVEPALSELPTDIQDAFYHCWFDLLHREDLTFPIPDIDWDTAVLTMKEAVDLRSLLRAQEYYLANEVRCSEDLTGAISAVMLAIANELPKTGQTLDRVLFTVPLVHLLREPPALVHALIATFSQDEYADAGLFANLRKAFYENLCAASNFVPYTEHKRPFAWPKDSKLPPTEIADTYLANTPFLPLFQTHVPLAVTRETLFSHMHVVGGSGAGKTQWLSTLILHHLNDPDPPSLVIVDSQSDLIAKLSRLEALKDRAILITPKDIQHPPAINMFDVKHDRLQGYDAVAREQVVAGAIQTFDYLFSGLVGADLTAKQSVFFRFVCRLLLTLPDTMGRSATILDMINLMEDATPYQPAIDKLPPIQRKFFERDFKDKTFQQTKEQIRYRLNSILENPTLERLFSAPVTRTQHL